MTKLEKIAKLLTFYRSPETNLKKAQWTLFSRGEVLNDETVQTYISYILASCEDCVWTALDD